MPEIHNSAHGQDGNGRLKEAFSSQASRHGRALEHRLWSCDVWVHTNLHQWSMNDRSVIKHSAGVLQSTLELTNTLLSRLCPQFERTNPLVCIIQIAL